MTRELHDLTLLVGLQERDNKTLKGLRTDSNPYAESYRPIHTGGSVQEYPLLTVAGRQVYKGLGLVLVLVLVPIAVRSCAPGRCLSGRPSVYSTSYS